MINELQPLTQFAQFVLPDFSCNLTLQQHELLLARLSIGQMVSSVAIVMQIVIYVLEQLTQIAQFVLPPSTYNHLQQYDLLRARTAIGEVVSFVQSVM